MGSTHQHDREPSATDLSSAGDRPPGGDPWGPGPADGLCSLHTVPGPDGAPDIEHLLRAARPGQPTGRLRPTAFASSPGSILSSLLETGEPGAPADGNSVRPAFAHAAPRGEAARIGGGGGLSLYDVEELFTTFEHHSALAQLALEELQSKLASLRVDAELDSPQDDPPLPDNIIPFPAPGSRPGRHETRAAGAQTP